MKKQLLCLLLLSAIFAAKAQTSQNVKTTGNTLSSSEYIGSNNNEDLVVKTNGSNNTIFKKNGEVKMTSLQGTGNRVLYATDNGVLSAYPFGQPGQILTADGIWIDPPTSYWTINSNGNKLYTTINKVGINTSSPNYTLDVNGDGHFTGNLTLNGELIITDKITTPKKLKTSALETDSIKMDSTKAIYGKTTVKGDVSLKFRLDVTGDAYFNGNQNVVGGQYIGGSQYLQGDQVVNGSLTARQGILFNGIDGLRYTPAVGTNKAIYTLGNGSTTLRESICVSPDQNQWFQMHGGYISRVQAGAGTGQVNSSLTMMSAPWDGNGVIEVEGVSASGQTNNGLLVNYFCGRNTYINTNSGLSNRGGIVYMGESVSMARYVGIGNNWPNLNVDGSAALNIFANEDNQTALKLNVWNGSVKAIDVVNPGNNISNFTVMQNGDAIVGGNFKMAQYAGPSNTVAYFDANGNLRQGNPYNSIQSACVNNADSWHIGGDNIAGMTAGDKAVGTCDNEDFKLKANSNVRVWIKANNGSVGIGTSNPSARLMIENDNNGVGDPNLFVRSLPNTNQTYNTYLEHSHTDQFFRAFGIGYRNPANNQITENFAVYSNGRTTIGNKKVITGPYTTALLSVYGTIAATEVQVFNNSWWADYVFDNDYRLMPLNEVEYYYKTNHHLPNVPSKAEVEEKGTNLAETDATLLRKIEENTLYLVELNKKFEALSKENDELKTKIKELEKK